MAEIGLVSGTESQRDQPARPADLYMESALFRKARAYAEANHDRWYILSAKHGLLAPDGPPIDPYDESLSRAPVDRKRTWARSVSDQLGEAGLLTAEHRLVFHAGQDYIQELFPLLEQTAVEVATPTGGLRRGGRLAWYDDRL